MSGCGWPCVATLRIHVSDCVLVLKAWPSEWEHSSRTTIVVVCAVQKTGRSYTGRQKLRTGTYTYVATVGWLPAIGSASEPCSSVSFQKISELMMLLFMVSIVRLARWLVLGLLIEASICLLSRYLVRCWYEWLEVWLVWEVYGGWLLPWLSWLFFVAEILRWS